MIVFSISSDVINLLYIMVLPLIDGAYLSIVLTSQLENIFSSIIIGSSVLSGIASISMAQRISGKTTTKIKKLIKIALVFLLLLVLTTILAETISSYLNTDRIRKFAGISIILIALKISDQQIFPEKVSKKINPSIIILIGIILSLKKGETNLTLILNKELLLNSMIAGTTAMSMTTIASLIDLSNYKKLVNYITPLVLLVISMKVMGII